MEEVQTGTSKTPIHFPPHRKSHLKSQTYFTLVRILSQCGNYPQLCRTAQADMQEPRPDNSSDEHGDASEKEAHKCNKPPHCMDHGSIVAQGDLSACDNVNTIGIQDDGFGEAHMLGEIENIMNTEKDDNPCNQKSLTVYNCTNVNNSQGEEFGDLQQLLMDELEHVLKGNEEVARDSNTNLINCGNQCAGDFVAYSDSLGHFDRQSNVIPECSNAGQQQVDKGCSSQKSYQTVDSSLLNNMTCEVSKLNDKNEDGVSFFRNNDYGSSVATQEKEMDFGKTVDTSTADSFSNHMSKGSEMEAGEISGEFVVSDKSVMPCEDGAVPQEQKNQLSEDVDRNRFPSSDAEEESRKDFGKATAREKVETNDFKNEKVCKRKIVVYEDLIFAEGTERHKRQKRDCETKEPRKANGDRGKKKGNVGGQIVCSNNSVSSIQNSDQTINGDKRIISKDKEMQDAGVCNKKERGPLSKEKKAKKKEKRRKKRAQKNRELGVKRLKLRPVQNPKPISYCRHYINGRCHEGEKCKFSHDTVPLTKSKPCGHFARNSCLKGDDCPFDHELSKYPCSNYASTGSCSRGEGCLFSHKLPLKEDLPSTSNVSTPDLKATTLPGSASSKKQLGGGGTSHRSSIVSPGILARASCKNVVQNMAKSVPSPPVLAPKGISFLSSGKSSITESNHSTPSSSSLTRNERFKAGNTADQNMSEKTQNSDDMPKRTQPSMAPKGINFLALGKASLDFSINSGSKLSSPNNFSSHIQPPAIQVGKDATKGAADTTSWLNRMVQKNESASAQTESNVVSNVESSTDGRQSVQAFKISPEVHQIPSVMSQGPLAAPLGSNQSVNPFRHSWLKDAPNLAQRAVTSTLAFAAKVESEMKMKQSTSGVLPVSSRAAVKDAAEGHSSTPISSKNDSTNVLKILDFLSSFSVKRGSN